jgi:hypothetical protein
MAGLALAADDFVSINMADVATCCGLLWRIQLGRRRLFRQMAGLPRHDRFGLCCGQWITVYVFICLQTSSSRADILPPSIVVYFNSRG